MPRWKTRKTVADVDVDILKILQAELKTLRSSGQSARHGRSSRKKAVCGKEGVRTLQEVRLLGSVEIRLIHR